MITDGFVGEQKADNYLFFNFNGKKPLKFNLSLLAGFKASYSLNHFL